MMDQAHCVWTQRNNVVNNLNLLWAIKEVAPDAHLVKLGTMGEYGTPGPGYPRRLLRSRVSWTGRSAAFPAPGWQLVSPEQGARLAQYTFSPPRSGAYAPPISCRASSLGHSCPRWTPTHACARASTLTNAFGTAINRFCCQAVIGHPLTLFGLGRQKRGFLPLIDSVTCMRLALENPPAPGEYRVS